MSLYILHRTPETHKAHYIDYVKNSKRIVDGAKEKIQTAVTYRDSLTDLFFQLLDSMAVSRKELAIAHGIKNAEEYGLRRDDRAVTSTTHTTQFSRSEAHYEQRMTALIQEHLTPIKRSLNAFEETSLEVEYPLCCDRAFKTHYDVINSCNKNELITTFSDQEYAEMYESFGLSPAMPRNALLEEMARNKVGLRYFKATKPQLYNKFKLVFCFIDLKTNNPFSKMSDWILATNRIEIDNQMVALSLYVTWTYRDLKNDPVERMKDFSKTTVIRQDALLIDLMLKKIAVIFERAIRSNTHNLTEIKKHTALMKYLFIHAFPFVRGTSGISEWLEQAVYKHQGYTLKYNKDRMPSYEALTLSWNDFYNSYDQMHTITDSD